MHGVLLADPPLILHGENLGMDNKGLPIGGGLGDRISQVDGLLDTANLQDLWESRYHPQLSRERVH